jgi:hypothetical protein
MADDTRDARTDLRAPVFLAWGMPMETREVDFDDSALWFTAGASLLAWTAVALLLTLA